jgi:hypothetical protein
MAKGLSMNVKILLPITVAWLLAGCASAPEQDTYTHRGGGEGVDITLDNLLESNEDRSYLVWLNAVRMREGAWESTYYLEVRYEGASDAGFLGIAPGETLHLTVDGQPMRFSSPGSEKSRLKTSAGNFVENAVYEVKPEAIKRIARAKEVKVQVVGKARSLYRDFKPLNIEKFRKFVLLHMGGF